MIERGDGALITDTDGQQTIDLSDYGISGQITSVIVICAAEEGDNVVMTNDYFTFGPPLP